MLAPIVIVFAGFCVPKSRLLCCLDKYANRLVSNIEYNAEDEDKSHLPGGVMAGELELRENIKLEGKGSLRGTFVPDETPCDRN